MLPFGINENKTALYKNKRYREICASFSLPKQAKVEKLAFFFIKIKVLFSISVSSLRRIYIRLSVGQRKFLPKIQLTKTPSRVLRAREGALSKSRLLPFGINENKTRFFKRYGLSVPLFLLLLMNLRSKNSVFPHFNQVLFSISVSFLRRIYIRLSVGQRKFLPKIQLTKTPSRVLRAREGALSKSRLLPFGINENKTRFFKRYGLSVPLFLLLLMNLRSKNSVFPHFNQVLFSISLSEKRLLTKFEFCAMLNG